MSFIIAVIIGALTGIMTGAGIGGGTILVLYLTAVLSLEQITAQGINLLYFIVCAPSALICHIKNGLVEIKLGLLAALSGSAVALPGAMLAQSIDAGYIKKAMCILFIAVGLKELFAKKEK